MHFYAALGPYRENMASALAQGIFHLFPEVLHHIRRHEGLHRTGKAAAVDTVCAPALQILFTKSQRHSHSLVFGSAGGQNILQVHPGGAAAFFHQLQKCFKITLLQLIKRIVPPMGNEFITLVKDTALVRIISVYELIWAGEAYIKLGAIWPLFYTGAFYLIVNGLLTLFLGWFEKKLDYFRG